MRLPATIGKYRIEEYLGGGMAEVYRAEDTVLDRRVAFKQLSPAGVADERVRARFLEEARVGAQLSHDNIVRTFDYGEDCGQPFIVMEMLSGDALSARIKSGQLGSFPARAQIALEMARALEYLHGHKILHRDIKPDNVHIDARSGRVRLIDFGIAKSQGMNLTQAGFVVGTPFYMAPEQLSGAPIGPATDVYAFGLVFFEILTGKRARPAETVERVLQQILSEPVDYAPLAESGVPEPLAQIVSATTQADVNLRPADFTGVIAQLENWIESQKTPTGTTTAPTVVLSHPAPAAAHRKIGFRQMALMVTIAAVIGGGLVGVVGVSIARARRLPDPVPVKASDGGAAATQEFLKVSSDGMISIPGGSFLFGEERHPARVEPYQIDRTEVTNDSYAAFCALKRRPLPPNFQGGWPGQPVTNVTIADAREFCLAQGKRLPNEHQWERAARGTAGARFPWGNQADEKRSNSANGFGHLVSADSMREGATAEGVLHMTGNVAEWVDHERSPSLFAIEKFANLLTPPASDTEPWFTVKGGSFRMPLAESSADLWLPAPARYHADDLGFRCVK
ncbi:MAG TPA: bifunctional serine/threonine-protein kinase/formylglycine-generating enzyme family protein [Bryobacteraceae bacterium]|jgi:serine/threonine-protein kinase